MGQMGSGRWGLPAPRTPSVEDSSTVPPHSSPVCTRNGYVESGGLCRTSCCGGVCSRKGCTYMCICIRMYTRIHVYTLHIRCVYRRICICVYARRRIHVYTPPYVRSLTSLARETCPCARVNDVSGPFFMEEGLGPLPKHCLFVSTTCRQCLQLAGCGYLWCTVSTYYTWANVYVHSVYKLCTTSTNYAQCVHVCTVSTALYSGKPVCHSVYKLCTLSTYYTTQPQGGRGVISRTHPPRFLANPQTHPRGGGGGVLDTQPASHPTTQIRHAIHRKTFGADPKSPTKAYPGGGGGWKPTHPEICRPHTKKNPDTMALVCTMYTRFHKLSILTWYLS